MATNNNLKDFFVDIADAIRSKKQYTVATTPQEWVDRMQKQYGITMTLAQAQQCYNYYVNSASIQNPTIFYNIYLEAGAYKIAFMGVSNTSYPNATVIEATYGLRLDNGNGTAIRKNALIFNFDIQSRVVGSSLGSSSDSSGYLDTVVQEYGDTGARPYTAKISPQDFAQEIRNL